MFQFMFLECFKCYGNDDFNMFDVIGAIGRRRHITSGLELEILPQRSSKEPTQECEFL
jgi:hypothetical protein